MNKLFSSIFIIFTLLSGVQSNTIPNTSNSSNGCVTFTVGQGTGCDWMCNYCYNQLGTSNYYFTDDVCTYQSGGCVGNPIAGKQYTCCATSDGL